MDPSEIARHKHIPSEVRWGDTKIVELPAGAFPAPIPFPTTQIVRVEYERPTTWALALVCDVPTGLVGEGASIFLVEFQAIIGVGSTSVTIKAGQFALTAASLALSDNQVSTFLQVPSKDIQIGAKVTPPGVVATPEQFVFSALACPIVK